MPMAAATFDPSRFDPNGAALEGSGIFGLPFTPEEAKVILLPVPWEVTTSYRPGTAGGPGAILAASRQVDLYDVETGRPYRAGIAMVDPAAEVRGWNDEGRRLAEPIIAAGGEVDGRPQLEDALARVNQLGEQLNGWVRAQAERWIAAERVVGVVGGDHSTPFGLIQALAAAHPGMGILHIDAHADLRQAYEGFTWSHASIMYNVMERVPQVGTLVQVAIRDLCEAEVDYIAASGGRVIAHYDAELTTRLYAGEGWAVQCERIVDALPAEVYLSFDIDGLDPTLCPHTGTPVPGGLDYTQAVMLIGTVARSGRRIIGFDLNEVAPGPDDDEWDANVGARILYKMIGWALRSQGL
jgi:agmatinase